MTSGRSLMARSNRSSADSIWRSSRTWMKTLT